ncbi:hypothetical protein DAEQUDRAFT_765420 [Daedalea quercina L-15889]|uniref:Uncharacterized protein n=1 Tax=Daedalea quercina L-15889 TaxID=1314783 RepID=A0A165QKB6_9APHY|nr:hypothetical protein DAEQUDRAFT_765420 [Daedalea quercina L-15889]
MFYFDPDDYTITELYIPKNQKKPPLPHGNIYKLDIGHDGASTDHCLQFPLPPGINKKSVFLKVFVSTEHVDMKDLCQGPIQSGDDDFIKDMHTHDQSERAGTFYCIR